MHISITNLGVMELDRIQQPTLQGSGRIVLNARAVSLSRWAANRTHKQIWLILFKINRSQQVTMYSDISPWVLTPGRAHISKGTIDAIE